MSDTGETHHKRSISSALSLLRRKEGKDDDENFEDSSNFSRAETIKNAIPSPTSNLHIHKHKSISSASNLMRQTNRSPNQSSTQLRLTVSQPSQTQEKSMSIEQLVKKYRLFEALRSGDTASISKAIRESDRQKTNALNTTTSSSSHFFLEETTILHLAIQCAELPVIEYVLSDSTKTIDINARDKDGNTPLHLAALQGRSQALRLLLEQPGINDSLANYLGKFPLDLARTPEIFQELQLFRSLFVEEKIRQIQELVSQGDYKTLSCVLEEPRVKTVLDINGGELVSDPATVESGGTLLHEAARKKDTALIQVLFLHGADPFYRDYKGKLPQDVTKDDNTRSILKRSPAAIAAQRGIQEKAVLGNVSLQSNIYSPIFELVAGKECREMKGYLKKWTNYRKGYQLRWFVLEDGVLSYSKNQEDAGSACRGAINMKIAKLHMDPTEKTKFDILGKSSVKYNLKANHEVEAKRWFWALNNSIQWTKDQAKEEEKQRQRNAELLLSAKIEHSSSGSNKESIGDIGSESGSFVDLRRNSIQINNLASTSTKTLRSPVPGNLNVAHDYETVATGPYEPSHSGDARKLDNGANNVLTDICDDDDDDYDEGNSDRGSLQSKDAFDITAQSVKLQLEVMGQVNSALQAEQSKNPDLSISEPSILSVSQTFESLIQNLQGLIGDLVKISREQDTHWQLQIDREVGMRRFWEENMAAFALEQESLEAKFGRAEEKRKWTKRALRDAIEGNSSLEKKSESNDKANDLDDRATEPNTGVEKKVPISDEAVKSPMRAKTILTGVGMLSDSESDEEFFDAVDAGEVKLAPKILPNSNSSPIQDKTESEIPIISEILDISPSFKGYEDGYRKKLKIDTDDRPKISLWGILKSMIGKDMTKMTLPVSFNEPTSLLQRCAEDMEYAYLLNVAADRKNSTERMVYVAAFAASEYSSTIGRVAKPFNPLLGETFEYVQSEENYRFFIEQVSHHPPIGAAWAESPRWTYWGESAVKSKFYGKSLDIFPLGTWFLKLRTCSGTEELYSWKKVTTSVIGIITGTPSVDNYGPMEIKNWNTGETCLLEFKSRGWKASSWYNVSGYVKDADGKTCYSIGGHWNSKIYARLTPGYETTVGEPKKTDSDPNQAFVVWEANERPANIPFNLTPFVITLNDDNPKLFSWLPPTDSRLRPDQRAMEDGRYDEAASEKVRVEEKQRSKRREREERGEEFIPHWFSKSKCTITGETYWKFSGKYWDEREKVPNGNSWANCERIFDVD